MEIISNIPQYVEIILGIIGAASVMVKFIAKAWKITPGTPSTDVFTRTQAVLHRIQRALGPIAGDTAKDETKNASR